MGNGTLSSAGGRRQTDLAKLVVELASDEARLKEYQSDPQGVSAAAGLTPEEQEVLQQGTFAAIVQFFFEDPRGDITTINVGSGTGPGTGGGGGGD
ncbi:MAG: hypothetical protein AAGD06_21275 [Acidobacteriota bacterium]